MHWGEETFLDLIEHVADLSRDAPILLLCMARPELLDRRTGWAGGKVNATSVLLEPLAPEETGRLIENLAHLDDDLRGRILDAAEGNPLFVEEMVAFVAESGGGEITVPPTIQALLAARLDQLDAPERDVLERGSVEGRVFHRGAVQALAPEEPQVMARLTSLVRKELVRPDKSELPGEDAFRFRHLLDPRRRLRRAPEGDPGGAARALRRLAGRARTRSGRAGRDPRLPPGAGVPLPRRARGGGGRIGGRSGAEALAAAGRRALVRQDFPAAVNLLQRAAALVPPDEIDRILMADLVDGPLPGGPDGGRVRVTPARSPRGRLLPATGRAELCARIEQEGSDACISSPRAPSSSWRRPSRRRCPSSRPPGTISGSSSPTPGSCRSRTCAPGWTQQLEAIEHALEHTQQRRSASPLVAFC